MSGCERIQCHCICVHTVAFDTLQVGLVRLGWLGWAYYLPCVCLSVGLSGCLSLYTHAFAGLRGDLLHLSPVYHLHCHCLLVLLVPKRCRSVPFLVAPANSASH